MASPCCIGELEQVVDGADHRPLGSDLVEAGEAELAEASCMLDLAEHRLDDLLSEKGKIFVVAVSGVGRDFLGIGTLHRADVGEERECTRLPPIPPPWPRQGQSRVGDDLHRPQPAQARQCNRVTP